jgi:hypothetical protein
MTVVAASQNQNVNRGMASASLVPDKNIIHLYGYCG